MARRKTFERQVIRKRNRIEKRGQKLAFNAIKKQYKEVFDLVGVYNPKFILDNLSVSSKPIQDFMNKYYPMFSEIGLIYRKNALSQKNAEDEFFENTYMERLLHFALTETGANVTSITATTEKFIRGAIESAVQQGVEEGLGVDKVSRLIRKNLTDSLGNVGRSRSKMIAQTEMISGSNLAAEQAIDDTGFDYIKFWSTSGLENTRDSHIHAQDAHPKGIRKGEAFDMGDGTFMQRPGDPAGGTANVINCRCTLLQEVI